MDKKLIAPSILSADFSRLKEEVMELSKAGADWLHVDVMDGHFVNNISIGIPVLASLKKISPLPLDVHLMITQPEKYVDAFLNAGADYLTIHVESTNKTSEILNKIRNKGKKAGITLRPGTDISVLVNYLHQVDLVLVMSVEPGFGGQAFMPDQVSKISFLKEYREEKGLNYLIEIDGGLNNETVKLCKDADVIVAGSYVFKGNYKEQINSLR